MLTKLRFTIGHAALLFSLAAVPLLATTNGASAVSETNLHSFCGAGTSCPGGSAEAHELLQDGSGNLYGITGSGGANGEGAVFKLAKSGSSFSYTELYSFCPSSGCADGAGPVGALIMDTSGNLYGTTASGGAGCSANPNGCGTIYELSHSGASWTLTTLYSFCPSSGCADGRGVASGLTYVGAASGSLYDGSSTLFGATTSGGTNDRGAVYKLTGLGGTVAETVLYSFCPSSGCADGAVPQAIITDASGDIFGATAKGGVDTDGDGFGDGVVYELAPQMGGGYAQTVLYTFCPSDPTCPDGENPNGHLVMDGSGNLFGTAIHGGTQGDGVLFKFAHSGASWTESVLHTFCTVSPSCTDGALPQAGLSLDSSGNLFGTAQFNGANLGGTLYEQSGSTFSVIYAFCNLASCTDGKAPVSGAIVDGSGKLYGTTQAGGANDGGVVFKVHP